VITAARPVGDSRRFLAVVVSVAITTVACAREAPRQSTHTTRQAVASLRLGMSEHEVTAILGEPVSRLAASNGSVDRVVSHYSEAGGWRVPGIHTRFFRTGFTMFVEFRSGRLSEAWLNDPDKGVCACVPDRCAPDWATQCG
jgi:hypothetical protein